MKISYAMQIIQRLFACRKKYKGNLQSLSFVQKEENRNLIIFTFEFSHFLLMENEQLIYFVII